MLLRLLLLLLPLALTAQPAESRQVEYRGKRYWLYQPVDTINNWWVTFNYQYDTAGNYLGWVKTFPRDGEWIRFFIEDSSRIATIFTIKNSLPNGPTTTYYLTGEKQCEFNLTSGILNGCSRCWYPSGQPSFEHYDSLVYYSDFSQNVPVGNWKEWYANGQVSRIEQYDNGDLHGIQQVFYENGRLMTEIQYDHGKKDGNFTTYYENGQLKARVRFAQDSFVAENPYTEYHPNGRPAAVGNRENDRRVGQWTFYYDNGQKESEGTFGVFLYRHEHGDILWAIKKGLWVYWYPTGATKAFGRYDLEPDTWEFAEGTDWVPAERQGEWLYFAPDGKTLTQEAFEALGEVILD